MVRLTKKNRQRMLEQNEGFSARSSFDSKNSTYEREYRIANSKLLIREIGKTSWSDSRYNNSWVANDKEVHRFLYKYLWQLNTEGLE